VAAEQLGSSTFGLMHVWFTLSWIVKESTELSSQVNSVLRSVDRELAVARVIPLPELIDDAFAWARLMAAFLLAAAAFTLLLAVVGLFSIVAHEVQGRRAEIGLRLALGASPRRSILATGRAAMVLTLCGLALGGAAGVWLAPILTGRLIFGVPARDPLTLGAVALVMTVTAAAACFVPAARAARIDPADVLRSG
jgi:putative ABC transport system permease protein